MPEPVVLVVTVRFPVPSTGGLCPKLTRQIRPPRSSLTSSAPSGITSRLTGRPQREPSASCQPVTKSSIAVGWTVTDRTRTTVAPVGTLRLDVDHECISVLVLSLVSKPLPIAQLRNDGDRIIQTVWT